MSMRQLMDLFSKIRGGSEQKVWKCEHCNMIFDDKERMKRHKRKAHAEKGGNDMPNTNPFGF
jgi:uncharacterized C2H2 Zn-finger protein